LRAHCLERRRQRHRRGQQHGVARAERNVAEHGVAAVALHVDDLRLFDGAAARHHDMNRDLETAPAKSVQVETPVPHHLLPHEVAHAIDCLVAESGVVAGRRDVGLSCIGEDF
jgi:hypothetical protein